MTTTQKNKRNSYLRIRDTFNAADNGPLIQGVNALKKAAATYLEKVEELNELARRESELLIGIAEDKASLKQAMCEDALPIAGAVRALAGNLGDGELRAQMDVNLSGLAGLRDRDCADSCETISERAEEHQLVLVADYGITAEQLDKFAALVEAFDEAIGKPKNAISRRKKISEAIRARIKAIDDFLADTLDELMMVFRERLTDTAAKKTRRAFFDTYTEGRRIENAAASRPSATPVPVKPVPAPV